MYSASVSTYPDSSSSRIFLQNLKRNDPGRPGRYSLKPLNEAQIKSKEPSFTSRQTIIRLDGGVQQIKLGKNNEVTSFNGNSNNATFGIVQEYGFKPNDDEWSKCCCLGRFVLSLMTVDLTQSTKKKTTASQNTAKDTASAKTATTASVIWATSSTAPSWRSAGIGNFCQRRDGAYLQTKRRGQARLQSEAQLYPGTMPRKNIENNDSTLAKELRAFAEKGYVGDRYGVDGGFVLRQVTHTKTGKTACLCSARWALAAEARMPWI